MYVLWGGGGGIDNMNWQDQQKNQVDCFIVFLKFSFQVSGRAFWFRIRWGSGLSHFEQRFNRCAHWIEIKCFLELHTWLTRTHSRRTRPSVGGPDRQCLCPDQGWPRACRWYAHKRTSMTGLWAWNTDEVRPPSHAWYHHCRQREMWKEKNVKRDTFIFSPWHFTVWASGEKKKKKEREFTSKSVWYAAHYMRFSLPSGPYHSHWFLREVIIAQTGRRPGGATDNTLTSSLVKKEMIKVQSCSGQLDVHNFTTGAKKNLKT